MLALATLAVARPQVPGGYYNIDVNNEKIQEIASFAAKTVTANSNGDSEELVRVVDAKKQVVTGYNYILQIETTNQKCTVKVYDQARAGVRQVKEFSCTPLSNTTVAADVGESVAALAVPGRQLLGGFHDVDVDDDRVQNIAVLATNKISASTNGGLQTLVRVLEAKRQVVNGFNYRLKIETNARICTVNAYEQPRGSVVRIFNFACVPIANPSLTDAPSSTWTETPSTTTLLPWTEAPSSTTVLPLTEAPSSTDDGEVISELVSGSPLAREQVESSETPFVREADAVADLIESEAPVDFDRTVSQDPPRASGSFFPADVNNPDLQDTASFAASTISESTNGALKLVRVIAAETQKVAGIDNRVKGIYYRVKIELQDGSSDSRICTVTVFGQPWTNTRMINELSCTPSSAPSVTALPTDAMKVNQSVFAPDDDDDDDDDAPAPFRLVGGYDPINNDDVAVQEMASFAAATLSASSNSGPLSLVRVIEAQTQVVAGRNFILKVELSGVQGSQICTVKIFDQSWTRTRRLNDYSCVPSSDSVTAAVENATVLPAVLPAVTESATVLPPILPPVLPVLRGAYSSVDVEDATIQDVASFAMTTMQASNSEPMTLLKITSAAKQSAGGVNYKITMEVDQADKNTTCEVVANDQPWLNKRDLLQSNCF